MLPSIRVYDRCILELLVGFLAAEAVHVDKDTNTGIIVCVTADTSVSCQLYFQVGGIPNSIRRPI